MARPHKRRDFGGLTIIKRGEHKYLRATYEPPLEAFSKWKGRAHTQADCKIIQPK